MMRQRLRAATILVAVTLAVAALPARGQATAEQTEQAANMRASVEDVIHQSGLQAAVAFRSLDGNREMFIDADEEFPATPQWTEIPVMIELQAAVEARRLKLDNTVLVENQFHSAADQGVYRLDPSLDPDRELYNKIGRRVTLSELNSRMMKRNSQLATNLLMQLLGIGQIDARLAGLRASGIRLRHGFQDLKAESAGERNVVTARSMMEVLWALATDTAVSADASKEMVGLIANARTATSGPFAAGHAAQTANKDDQEALIVYGAHSFALAVIVKGAQSGAASAALIAKISHALAAAN